MGRPIINNNVVGHHKRGIAITTQMAFGNCGNIAASNIFFTSETPHYPAGYGVALGTITPSVFAVVDFLVLVFENRTRDQWKYDYLLALPAGELAELGDDYPSFSFTY